jgi:hypothetical protein
MTFRWHSTRGSDKTLGAGIPFFANLENTPIKLEDSRVVEGVGVTHMEYKVKKD